MTSAYFIIWGIVGAWAAKHNGKHVLFGFFAGLCLAIWWPVLVILYFMGYPAYGFYRFNYYHWRRW